MKLFDSHCHLDDEFYGKDLDEVISHIEDSEIEGLMLVGIDQESSRKAVSLAESQANFYASIGIHPHDARECSEETLTFLSQLAQSPKVKAWGEIGLDFNRMYSPRNEQEKWFFRQLQLANSLNLPMIFHERDSKGRFLQMLKAHYPPESKGVVHCFSGNKSELCQYLDLGLYIGITGIVTIKTRGEELRKMVPSIPIDRLLIETDAPFLTPAPEKNHFRRNEPIFVKSVLLKLAQVRGEDPEYLAQKTYENACNLFGVRNENSDQKSC